MVAFPGLWLLGIAAAQIHVLAVQRPWSGTAWVVMITVPAAFLLGGALARAVVKLRVAADRPRGHSLAPRRLLLLALLVVGYLELGREFAAAGSVPLLSGHIDAARTAVSGGPLSLLADALTVCLILAVASPRRLWSRAAMPELIFAGLALAGPILGGGRETALVPLAAAMLARALYWRPPSLRSVLVGGVLGAELFSLVFYLRTGQDTGQAFTRELYGKVVPATPAPLIPLLPVHFLLALNETVLARVVDYFPHRMAFGHGVYDAYALHFLVPSKSLGTVTRVLTPPWFTSTLAGPMWADGGLPIVAIGCLVTGAITTGPYILFDRTRRFPHALLAGYFATIAVFGVYDSLLTQYKDWVFVAAALLLLGRACELAPPEAGGPPGAS